MLQSGALPRLLGASWLVCLEGDAGPTSAGACWELETDHQWV